MAKTSSSTSKAAAASKSKKSAKPSTKAKILGVLASQRALGKNEVEKEKVLRLAIVTNKHTFDTTCALLKKKGSIDYDGGMMKITELGLEEVGPDAAKPPENNDAAQEMLKQALKGGSKTKAMFDILTTGNSYTRAELAEKVDMDVHTKTFKTYISYLSKIVEKVEGGKIRLQDSAFPCGRPCDE